MENKLAAKRYAAALIAACDDKELTRAMALLDAASALFNNKKFAEIAKSPLVPNSEKCDLINAVLSEKPPKIVNLVKLLAEKNRLMALPAVAKEVRSALSGRQSAYNGLVYSQKPLAKGQLEDLAKSLTARLKAEVKLTQAAETYEGVKVAIDDLGVEVDFSKTRIKSQILGHILRGL
ncbi:MAG: F0F1 ATP synthase subunit delta [Helicobacteraceae bacterium]|jgi:F-type H+-transporting ATPase subunit delta|nr:F0F1 ATP synthase subunit delta [Helicobacteraceae bacterium]